ncbi:MAG: sugar transferase [Planctomycetaceae bacterium]|nr:sugar transferase [Planctomycetaceae bacterium]
MSFSHVTRGYRCPKPYTSPYFQIKSHVDRVVALLLLIPCLPIIGFLVLLVRMTSKGPGIYAQERLGKDGKPFIMYKIRSMVVDAEQESGAVWASRNDSRVTLVGKLLRKFHLDELPQILNVLRGEMSLVGPRPERDEFVRVLNREVDGYSYRMSVPPGVTGYAQLNLPSDVEVADVKRKIALDFEYIENASFWFDFVILLGTLGRFFKFLGIIHLKVLGVYRRVEDSPWAVCVGAVSENPGQGRSMQLNRLFEMAAVDRIEDVRPVVL